MKTPSPLTNDTLGSTSSEIKEGLIAFAREVGFDACRIAPCAAPLHAEEFRDWLRKGSSGEMAYMSRGEEKRCEPEQVLRGARSLVVLALNYWQGEPLSDADQSVVGKGKTRGRIARYAWGDDYHDVVAEKLGRVDAFLQRFGGTQKSYVDTGPILERDHAARAGIGWHGKSTMLIDAQLGTWFFLAEILTTLDLPPDEPQKDRCGSCQRCVTACPTAAITSPHRLDARRCISYLTIELKTAIPTELRPLIGDRIFGCDECLDACPWNRFAESSREAAFGARPATVGMALRDYLELTDEGFRALFRKSPIKRIKRRGFLRNVCVALGNVGTKEDLPSLHRMTNDPDPLIAEHAAWAVERIGLRLGAELAKIS
jgi:epoxyqueuosine reductase